MVFHLLKEDNPYLTLCDKSYYEKGVHESVWCEEQKIWLNDAQPTCETCILIDFSDPANTYTCHI